MVTVSPEAADDRGRAAHEEGDDGQRSGERERAPTDDLDALG